MTTYEQWDKFLAHVSIGAMAEYFGFLDAKRYEKPLTYSDEHIVQSRYEQGFKLGKEELQAEEMPV